MKEIGFGIVGTGSIASHFARACAMVPGGVCGRNFLAKRGEWPEICSGKRR